MKKEINLKILKLDDEAERQIDQCLNLVKEIFGQDLLGIYLYGSSILGGLQKYSDIDLLVVSDRSIPNFDRKKGGQHNFETVTQIFNDLSKKHPGFHADWKSYWAKAFTFDALIGNTDRHQDNWGIIVNPTNDEMRISPVFDNGTSMGHEIFPNKFALYDDISRLEKYVSKGWHHMKWELNDTSPTEHLELLKKLADKYPETQKVMLDCLKKVNYEAFKDILHP